MYLLNLKVRNRIPHIQEKLLNIFYIQARCERRLHEISYRAEQIFQERKLRRNKTGIFVFLPFGNSSGVANSNLEFLSSSLSKKMQIVLIILILVVFQFHLKSKLQKTVKNLQNLKYLIRIICT